MSHARFPYIVRARWEAFAILRENGASLLGIAAVSGFDHSSIHHGLARYRELSP